MPQNDGASPSPFPYASLTRGDLVTPLRRLFTALAFVLPAIAGGCSDDETLVPVGTCTDTSAPPAGSPILYGQAAIAKAMGGTQGTPVRILLANDGCAGPLLGAAGASLDARPESYAVVASGGETVIVGRDPTGAMYGALEVAERIESGQPMPPAEPLSGAPDQPIRAGNLFLILPRDGETFDDWWFHDPSFWTDYLDLLARSRLNVLDLHGMYHLDNTNCPNALPYFASSTTFPDVGLPADQRARNVASLQRVVSMAAQRGIKVGFMTYRSDLSPDGVAPAPSLTDDQVGAYTREATADLARSVPDLWRLGFRIHESTHAASWFVDTFVAGLRDSGTNIGLYSRSWGTSRADMEAISSAWPGQMLVEHKYNGEQLGAPYLIADDKPTGNGWYYFQYSYMDYMDGSIPWQNVFQLRSGGTHRLFRHAHFDRIRTTVTGAKLGPNQGVSLEAAHGFFPIRDDYHASPTDRFSDWTFRRDELQYLMTGRLAYDPATPASVFQAQLARRTGTTSLWASLQAASDIVPWIQSVHTCGPDQRHFAPDLEWGGPVGYWAKPSDAKDPASPCDSGYHGPFDVQAFALPSEAAADLVAGRATSKLSPLEVARIVIGDAAVARAASSIPIDPTNPEARDVARECVALASFGDYFGHKLRAATALAIHGASGDQGYLDAARAEIALADAAWQALATDTAYIAPFADHMRMSVLGMPTYHWAMQVPHLGDDPTSIDDYVKAETLPPAVVTVPPASIFLDTPRLEGPGLAALTPGAPMNGWQQVDVALDGPVPAGATVTVWVKDFSGLASWTSAVATEQDGTWSATVPHTERAGYYFVEIVGAPGQGWRYPDVLQGAPYLVVNPG
jgi:hypothetical protein